MILSLLLIPSALGSIFSIDSLRSSPNVIDATFNETYSNAWVIDSVSHYFTEPVNGLDTAKQLIADGKNISAWEYYGGGDLAKRGISNKIEGAAKDLYDNPGLVDQFWQWFKNTISYQLGSLWQAPGGCWWYYASGKWNPDEKSCIGRLSNDEVLSGDKKDIISCPSSGYVCYKYHYEIVEPRAGREEDGTVWCVSPDKSTARSNGRNCKTFAIKWTGNLACA